MRGDLERCLVGRTISSVAVTGSRSVRRQHPEDFRKALTGRSVRGVERRGKYLVTTLDDGSLLVVHLRMSGQLLLVEPGAPLRPHTHAVVALRGGGELRFVDPRTFGEMFVAPPGRLAEMAPEFDQLGFDALQELPGAATLARLLAPRRARIKALLMDQHFIAGIGNIYSDEILFAAGLLGDRPAASLSAGEVRRLHRAIRAVLPEAIAMRGSTLPDRRYTGISGDPGTYQDRHSVYGRAGLPCPRCKAPVRRSKLAGRTSFHCPRCQT